MCNINVRKHLHLQFNSCKLSWQPLKCYFRSKTLHVVKTIKIHAISEIEGVEKQQWEHR